MDMGDILGRVRISSVDHLPVAATFCRRIRLIETVDAAVPTEMDAGVGTLVQAMVLDTLSGRSPLYRVEEGFRELDTELLLGRELDTNALNDTALARALNAVYDVGAEKVFSQVAFRATRTFPLDVSTVHFDTTSVSLWGDYDCCSEDGGAVNITYGKSKDHRPDLKQFLIAMLCTGRNIPLLGGCADGNASDKTLNNSLLTRLSKHMARHGLGEGAFLYVADSAAVTEDNLSALGANLFLTRLPATYNETGRVISEAVADDAWTDIGALAETPASRKRPAALYRCAEKKVTLYGKTYRAVVVHSSAHDKRRQKRIDRELEKSKTLLHTTCDEQAGTEFFCRRDAEAAAERLRGDRTKLHRIEAEVVEHCRYGPGRPSKTKPRRIVMRRYSIETRVVEAADAVQSLRDEAGCFVLLTNVPLKGPNARTGADLLAAYKEQHGIERDFSFLKDPLIVNDTFLKKPERIEALAMVLLIALLVWNLIEHVLRAHIAATGETLPGWDGKQTERPTAFMMSTKFRGMMTVRLEGERSLAVPLTPVQRAYVTALGLSPGDLLDPRSKTKALRKPRDHRAEG